MNRQELIAQLKIRLASLPQTEIDKTIAYYDEMIQDRIEDGMTEEEAVSGLGSIDNIVENCMMDVSIPALMMNRISDSKKNSKNKGLWTFLVILGSPVWLPLLLAGAAVLITVYISAWSVIIALYATLFGFAAGSVAGLFVGIVRCCLDPFYIGTMCIGAAFMCAALALFLYQPVKYMTKGLINMTKSFIRWIKSLIIRKGGEYNA